MKTRIPLTGPAVWQGEDIRNSRRWIRDLPAAAVAEFDAALAAVNKKGLAWAQITRADFPLSSLDSLLADIANELEHGSGIMKLRGFPVERYGEDDLRKIYFGLGTHLGTPVFQNRSGELMRAIRDEGAHVGRTYGETTDQKGTTFLSSYARTLTNGGLRFHTDRTDVVGLLCVRQALFGDYWRSRFGEEGTTKETAYALPIFGLRDGKFTSHYSLTFIEAAQMAPGVPKLTDKQKEAIEVLMATAEELCFEMTLEPGDLQLINSHVAYHGRTPFEDDFAAGQSRLLLRLWLTVANNRPLPAGHEILWRSIEAGQPRGGIQQVTI